jgi:hypothetical protein
MDGPNGIWSKGLGSQGHLGPEGGGIAERLVGPSDQSGKWQRGRRSSHGCATGSWSKTDDRRVHALGRPDSSGTLFELQKNTTGAQIIANGPERGNWFQTPYTTRSTDDLADQHRLRAGS